jgi:hypothetical protein
MKTPHKHAELIKAWADGAEIEVQTNGEWLSIGKPNWNGSVEYRIKPEQEPDFVRYRSVGEGPGYLVPQPDSNLKLTFDGATGELKSAEVLK